MLIIPHVPLPQLFHTIIRYDGHRPNIMDNFLSVKLQGYHDLVACRPKASGSLSSAHGRNDTLSKNTKCSIFRPFVISSCFHLGLIALFKKCKSNALALCAIAKILLA
jgi:hypothetical protein